MSLADEAWANEEFEEPYTLEQTFALGQAVNDGTFPVPLIVSFQPFANKIVNDKITMEYIKLQ